MEHATLLRRYIFVSPRGIDGSLTTLLQNPSRIGKTLLEGWDKHCRTRITARNPVELMSEIRASIEGYDFTAVEVPDGAETGQGSRRASGSCPGAGPAAWRSVRRRNAR